MLHLQTAYPTTISPSWNSNLSSSIYSFPLTPSPNQTRTLRIPANHSHQHHRLKPYHRARSDFDLRSSVLSPITPNSSTQHSIPSFPQTQSSSVRSSVSREPAAIASSTAANIAQSVPSAPQTPRATLQRSASLPQLQLPFPITPNSQLFYPSQVSGPAHAPIFIPSPSCPQPGYKSFIPPSEYLRAHLSRLATVQAYTPTVHSHPLKTFVTNTNYGSSHSVQRSGSGLSLFIPSCSYVDPTTSSITSIPHPDETFGSRQDVTHEVKEVSERRKEAEAREKQVYAMELVEIAIKTVNRVWPESRDVDSNDEDSNSTTSPLRSTAGSRHGPQQLTPASSPVMVPSSKKRKIGSVVKAQEDEDELQHSAKRRSVGVEERPSRSPSSYLPYRPSHSPTSMQYTTPTPTTNPITLRLFVRELLRRSKTSVQTLEVALCYLDGIEDTVQMLRDSYRSGKGYGTPELAEKGPYDEGSKDEGRILRLQDVVNTELIKLRMKVRSAQDTPLSPTSDITAAGSCSGPSLSTEKQVSAVTHKVESLSVDAPCSNSAFSSTTTAVMHSISPSVTVTSDSGSCPLIFKPPKMTPHQLLGTHPLLDARRTFLSALVLATKFLQDRAYSNKAWAKLSGLPGKEVGRCERALGGALGWRLWVGKDGNGENIRGISSPVSASSSPVEESIKSPSESSPLLPWTKVDDDGVHGVDDPLAAEFIKCANAARDREEQHSGFAKALEIKDVEGVLSIPGMREYIVLKNKVASNAPSQPAVQQPAPLRRQGSALVAGMVEISRSEQVQESQDAVDRWSSLAALEKETPIAPVDIQTWSEAVVNLVPSGDEQPFLPPGYNMSSDARSGRTPLLTMTERLPEEEISSGSGMESGSSSPLPPFVVEHQKRQLEALSHQQHPVQQQQAQWIVQQYQTGMQAPQFYSKPGGPGSMSAAAMDMLYKPSASKSAPTRNSWSFSMQPQQSQQTSFVHIPPPAGAGALAGHPPYHTTAVHSTVYMSPYSSPDDAPTPTQHSTSTPSCSSLSRGATLVDPLSSMDEYLKVTDGDRTPIAPFMMQPYF